MEIGAGTAAATEHGPVEVLDTPDTPTIETLATFLGITAGETLKNVVVKLVQPDGTVEALIVGVPGDREIDMKRLEANVAPAEVVAFEGEDFAKHPGLVRGYIGPQGDLGVRYVVDPLVAEGSAWVTGANIEGKHARNVVMGRDFTPGRLPRRRRGARRRSLPPLRQRAEPRPRHRDRPRLPARARSTPTRSRSTCSVRRASRSA